MSADNEHNDPNLDDTQIFEEGMAFGDDGPVPESQAADQASADAVVSMIAEVEKQLAGLKQVHTDRKSQQQELDARKAELDAQAADIEIQRTDVETQRAVIEAERADIDRLRNEAERNVEEASERERASIAEREAELGTREEQLRSAAEAVAEGRDELAAAREQFETDRAELDSRYQELDASRAELDERWTQFNTDREAFEESSCELTVQRSTIEEALADLDEQRTAFETERKDFERAQAAFETERAAADLRSGAAEADNDRMDAAAKALDERARALEANESKLEERITNALNALAESGREQAVLADALADAEREKEELFEQLSAVRADLEAKAAEAASVEERILAELADAEPAGASEQSAERITELETLLAQAESRQAQLEQTLNDATAAVEQAPVAEHTDVTKQLAEAVSEIDRLQAALDSAESASGDITDEAAINEALERVREELDMERAKRTDAEQHAAALERQLKDSGVEPTDGIVLTDEQAEWLRSRRERLTRAKHHVREQSRKVRRAGEMLKSRYKQCEELLSQRAELMTVRDALDNAQRRFDRQAAGGVAIQKVAMIVVIIAVLAGISWTATLQAFPGLYAVTATVSAESRGRTPTPDELEEWQAFHTELLEDPRFLEDVADRMRKRGIDELGSVTGLKGRMAADMDVFSAEPGAMVFEFQGRGRSRTERELGTFLGAFVAESNAMRARRSDPTVARLTGEPAGTRDPIDYKHLASAGAVFGLTLTGAIFLGAFIWGRMKKAKTKFEQQDEVDAVLAEARWEDPRAAA